MSLDDKSTIQNNGVGLEVEALQFSTFEYPNPVFGSMTYYAIIEEIWEVDDTMFIIPLFKCKWIDNKSSVKIDELGMTLVDFWNVGYRDEPFIKAHEPSQVFHVKDLVSEYWFVAFHGNKQIDVNEENLSNLHIANTHPFKTTINFDEAPLLDDIHAIQEDQWGNIHMTNP